MLLPGSCSSTDGAIPREEKVGEADTGSALHDSCLHPIDQNGLSGTPGSYEV